MTVTAQYPGLTLDSAPNTSVSRTATGSSSTTSTSVPDGITTIIGPNGCGKSTLLRALARLLKPRRVGAARRQAIGPMPTRDVARPLGLLPQAPVAPEGLTVADLVPAAATRTSPGSGSGRDDEAAVAEALALTGMSDLGDRPVDQLSGGQRQRAWISMALAQGTDLLLLDEPTTYLDLAHPIEVLELVDRLHAERGRTVVMVLHDLNLAPLQRAYRDAGRHDRRGGAPKDVITAELLLEVFGLEARVMADPVAGTPLVVPIGRLR